MVGSSFGGIYDAFKSFEQQMEEGLADIFDSSMRMTLPVLLLLPAQHSLSSQSLDAT